MLYPLSYGGSLIIIVGLKATLKFGRKHFTCETAVASWGSPDVINVENPDSE